MLKRFFLEFFSTLLVVTLITGIVFAAKPSKEINIIGNDISWPQCGTQLLNSQYFGIVGVNGGKSFTTNRCLSEQLVWASKSLGAEGQPKIQLYLNTSNQGVYIDEIDTWPTNNIDKANTVAPNPYGECKNINDQACSWQYGWNRGVEAYLDRFTPAAKKANISTNAKDYTWWLDVETVNTWQYDAPEAKLNNTAAVEGEAAYFLSKKAKVGLYSTTYQWEKIIGSNLGISKNLADLDSWIAGATTLKGAQFNCATPPLTGGKVTLTQFVTKNLDFNYTCR